MDKKFVINLGWFLFTFLVLLVSILLVEGLHE